MPPQQGKLVAETDKRLNLLYDMLNNEALSKSSADRVLDICQGASYSWLLSRFSSRKFEYRR